MAMFANKAGVDVATVLMLIGQDTIWKALWSRMRAQRQHWTHYIFTISPGWAPLAGTLFAAMNGSFEPPNLIFSRVPAGSAEDELKLTNLQSGATHDAKNTVLQTIWHTWKRGNASHRIHPLDMTKEVGVVDVDLDRLQPRKTTAIWIQSIGLAAQLSAGVVFSVLHLSSEVLVALCVTLASQLLLIYAVTPREEAWQRYVRNHRAAPVLLHKGLDSSETLLVRNAVLGGRNISLEEYCWATPTARSTVDLLSIFLTGIALMAFVFSILLISWMGKESKLLYLIVGIVGLFATLLDAALQPDWRKSATRAVSGARRCAPTHSSLISTIAVLIAAQFPSAEAASKHLFPDNARFKASLDTIDAECSSRMCSPCRRAISTQGLWMCDKVGGGTTGLPDCARLLKDAANNARDKQISDAMATLSRLLSELRGQSIAARIETSHKTATSPRHGYW